MGAVGDGHADDLQAIALAIQAAAEHGGTVRLSPGVYRVASDLTMPASVAFEIAHGAVLRVSPGATVHIASALDAGLYRIFDAAPGAVVFNGTAIPAVYPEWWGAHGAATDELAATDATEAIAAALRAGHTDRMRDHKSYPSIPVVLTSSYRITQPLVLEGNSNGFRLIGAQSVGSANNGYVTLYGDFAGRPVAPTMLTVRGTFGWSIESVNFHAGPGVGGCLHVEAMDGRIVQGANLRRCTFASDASSTALTYLVYVGRVVASSEGVSGDDVCTLAFDGCYFDVQARALPAGVATPDAVIFRAGNALGMLFTACFFGGRARSFIACGAGTFGLVACVFHNTNPAGCDVRIEAPGGFPPAAFTAVQCESQSWQFLATYTSTPTTLAVWPTVLVGLRHANVNAVDLTVPSVQWDAAGLGGALVLVGCRFYGDVHIGPNATAVLDLGTNFIPNQGPDPAGGMLRGAGFTGATDALRGIAGLMAHPRVGTSGAWASRAVRLGAKLLRLGEDPHEVTPSPWNAGDVWLRPPPDSAERTLSTTLHSVRVARGEHHAWEGVFGSENHSGPYVHRYDPAAQTLTVDTEITPSPRAVYEVLWDVRTGDGTSTPEAAAVGRDTVTVYGDATGCRVASQSNAGSQGVSMAGGWTEGEHRRPRAGGVPRGELGSMRFRWVLRGLSHDPGDDFRVIVRRLA